MSKFLRIVRYALPYRFRMLVGLLCVCAVALSGLIMPIVIKFVLDDVLIKPMVTVRMLGFTITRSSHEWLIMLFFGIVALYIFRGALSYGTSYLMSWIGQRVLFDIRNNVFSKLQELPMRFYEMRGPGQIFSRITGDVDQMGSMVTGQSIDLFTQMVMLVFIVAILLTAHWKLGLLALSVLPLYALNYKLFIKAIRSFYRALRGRWSQIYGEIYESIAGAKVVKAFSQEKHQERTFFKGMRETYGYSIQLTRISTAMSSISQFISSMGTALILLYGGLLVLNREVTPGTLVQFYSYLGMLYSPIVSLITMNETLQRTFISADRVFDILDAKSTVQESPRAYPMPPIEGHVVLDEVHFSYDPEKQVLHDINLQAEPGQIVALVGPSGSGKTTVANLIPRFYDPTKGRVMIDGHDLRDVTLKSLRAQMGMVLQESFLFSGTIRDNLRYGNPSATDQQIVEAAIAANAHKFIVEEMSEGYDSEVGDRGMRLSGGQRQRISIARAILRDPRVLILDEATSSLDSEAEGLIQEALERLMQGRTTFVIAHRLSTIMKSDLIVVVEEGKVVEQGNHHDLVAMDGLYARLYRKQFKLDEVELWTS